MMSASDDRPVVIRSRILLSVGPGMRDEDLARAKSFESVFCILFFGGYVVGAHLRRNCNVSNLEVCKMASGLSAIASMIGLRTLLIKATSRPSGSFSHSTKAGSASVLGIEVGSLRYCFRLSLMSKST